MPTSLMPLGLSRARTKGFTLLEMLATAAIVMVLASLLIPGLSKFRQTGERAKCSGNLRQIATAFQAYTGDHNGMLPPSEIAPAPARTCWDQELYGNGYVNDTKGFACPGDRLKRTDPQPQGINSYVLNGNVFYSQRDETVNTEGNLQGRLANAKRSPSQFVLVFERPSSNKGFNTRGSTLCTGPAVSSPGTAPDPNLNHTMGANYLFGDGHVEFLDYNEGAGSLATRLNSFSKKYFATTD